MYLQGSLLGLGEPAVDPAFTGFGRIALDDSCWLDYLPGWLAGDEVLFDHLQRELAWNHRTVTMYDRRLPEPRLTSWWTPAAGPEPHPVLAEIRSLLSSRYGETFDSIGFNCYRDGADSVAWHGDRHRHTVDDPIVVILSVGAALSPPARSMGSSTISPGSATTTPPPGCSPSDWMASGVRTWRDRIRTSS
jgi:hypothetical protein